MSETAHLSLKREDEKRGQRPQGLGVHVAVMYVGIKKAVMCDVNIKSDVDMWFTSLINAKHSSTII